MGRQTLRLQRQGLLKHLNRSGEITALDKRGPKIRISSGVFPVERNCFPQLSDGNRQIGFLHHRDAQPVVGLG